MIKPLIITSVLASTQAIGLYLSPYIDDYSDLAGQKISSLETRYGPDNVKQSSLPLHSPEELFQVTRVSDKDKEFFVVGDEIAERLLFRDRQFKTKQGAYIGQGYCQTIEKYSKALFIFSFEEGGQLQLEVKNEGIILKFDTSNLPLGKYIMDGFPKKKDKTLCDSKLIEFEIQKKPKSS